MTVLEAAMTPEQAALSLLASAARAKATPDLDLIAKTTGLTPELVGSLRDRLLSGKRGALSGLLPPVPTPAPGRGPVAAAPRVQPRWEEALTHPAMAVQRRARHIADLVAALEGDLAQFDEDLKLEARLVAQLEEVRARLPRTPAGITSCPDCGKALDSRGMTSHMKSHTKTRRSGEAMSPAG